MFDARSFGAIAARARARARAERFFAHTMSAQARLARGAERSRDQGSIG